MEKEKIREMLRDAVRILCQNTVSHHTKLSIKALIGITVDDSEEIIVSFNESVSANTADSYQAEEFQNTEADAGYPDYDLHDPSVNDYNQCNSTVSYGQQYNPSVPYQAVVKKETIITYNVGQNNTLQPRSVTANHTVNQYPAVGGDAFHGRQAANYGHQGAFNAGRGQKVTPSSVPRSRGRGQGLQRAPRQKMPSTGSIPVMKQEPGGEIGTNTGGKKTCSLETGEVSHVTLYTCQRCGKQFNNSSSFLRHKKSHLGIVYRCDGCGKILSRSDHLTAHRKRCAAALQQAPLDV